jgi:ankyrin repeat protein
MKRFFPLACIITLLCTAIHVRSMEELPLHQAVEEGKIEQVEQLLAAQADVNAQDNSTA